MKKILILGVTPPPIGGVSIHIQRFYDYCKDIKDIELKLFDIKKRASLIELIKSIYLSDIVHIHLSNNLKIIIAFVAKVLGKRVIYTHHNIRVNSFYLFKILLYFVDDLILVNDKDISSKIKSRYSYHLIPAFLPSIDNTPLPKDILDKIDDFDNIISTNCFQMTFIDNKDLYGFDIIIEAFASLVTENRIKNTILVVVDPSDSSKEYVQKLIKEFPYNQDSCEILYIGKPINFNELIKKSDITIRATRSDGDSLSVRESIFLKTPIIASDVTTRPEGTTLFKNGDSKDLAEKIVTLLNSSKYISHSCDTNYGEQIVNIYNS